MITSNPPVPIPVKLKEIGILVVVILQGRNLPQSKIEGNSKPDPYVVCSLSNSTTVCGTTPNKGGGSDPSWDEEFRFTVFSAPGQQEKMKVAVFYAHAGGEDESLGEGEVELGKWPKNEFDDWVSISVNGKPEGEIFLEATFYPVEPSPVKPIPHPLPQRPQSNSNLNLTRRPSRYTPAERLARPPIPYGGFNQLNTNTFNPSVHPHSNQEASTSRIQVEQYHHRQQHSNLHSHHLNLPGELPLPDSLRPGRITSSSHSQSEIPASLRPGRPSLINTSPPSSAILHHPHQMPLKESYQRPSGSPSHSPSYYQQQQQQTDPRFQQIPISYSPPLPDARPYSPNTMNNYPPTPYYPQHSSPYQYPEQQHPNQPFLVNRPPSQPSYSPLPSPSTSPHPPQHQQQYSSSIYHSSPSRPPSSNELQPQPQSQVPPPRPPKTPIVPPRPTSSSSPLPPPPPIHHSSASAVPSLTSPSSTNPTRFSSLPTPSRHPLPVPTTAYKGQEELADRIKQEVEDSKLAKQLEKEERESTERKKEEERKQREEREKLDQEFVVRMEEEEKRKEERERLDLEFVQKIEREEREKREARERLDIEFAEKMQLEEKRKEEEREKSDSAFVEQLRKEEGERETERKRRESDDERLAKFLAAER